MTSYLQITIEKCPIIKKLNYEYIIHPLCDGFPEIDEFMLSEWSHEIMAKCGGLVDIDKIVTIESMGIPIATKLCTDFAVPLNIIRKRRYGLEGEMSFDANTGYSASKYYINGLRRGDRVVIVDDILSTGGTMEELIKVLQANGICVMKVLVFIDKGDAKEKLEDMYGVPIYTLYSVRVINGEITVIPSV